MERVLNAFTYNIFNNFNPFARSPSFSYSAMLHKNNATIYGMQSDVEKWLWITYLITVSLSSLLGDIIILVASIRHDALRLNKVIIAIMQQIAVCDLTLCLAWVLPMVASTIAKDWILGDTFAQGQELINLFAYPMNNVLVCFLTTAKFLMVRYPMKTRIWTAKGAHIFCGVFWLALFFNAIAYWLEHKEDLIFDYTTYEIDFNVSYSRDGATSTRLVVGSLQITIIAIIILTSVLTLRLLFKARDISRRGNGSVRWQGILTVSLTAAVFCISSLPSFLYFIAEPFVDEAEPLPGFFHVQLKRISEYSYLVNVMSNFYIYSLTVPSFRRFLRTHVFFLSGKVVAEVRNDRTSQKKVEEKTVL